MAERFTTEYSRQYKPPTPGHNDSTTNVSHGSSGAPSTATAFNRVGSSTLGRNGNAGEASNAESLVWQPRIEDPGPTYSPTTQRQVDQDEEIAWRLQRGSFGDGSPSIDDNADAGTADDAAIAAALQADWDQEAARAAEQLQNNPELDRQILLALQKASVKGNRRWFRPAVNTIILPSNDDVYFQKRLRIQKLLTTYGLEEKVIPGDGNCQFASLSDQLYRTPKKHKHVRDNIVAYLSRNARDFAHFVPEPYPTYLARMSKKGEWGDHVTLQAAADFFRVQINLVTSYEDQGYMEIQPKGGTCSRILWLSFFAEVHYNSVYPKKK